MANLGNRIVVLIDMDCFFCQVETRLKPEYAGKPMAVVQYNLWRGGGIIAVNYEARDFGVTRHMRGEEAKEKCPDIVLATVPALRGKADTSRYRSAGREVIDVLKKHCNIVERASVDEAYLDITQIVDEKLANETVEMDKLFNELDTTYVVGHSEIGINDEEQRKKGLQTWLSESSKDPQIKRLALAGLIIENIRKDIFKTTSFKCSAGISFNKILAKLACGLHKPNRQTILPASSVPELFGTLPVKKVRHLGGKLGDIVIDSLKCNVMADLLPYSLQQLQSRFDEKTGSWLYNIARGIDNELVTPRLVSKSIGACKRFPGKQAITDVEVLKHWLGDLSAEVCERLDQDLEENERKASLLTISFQFNHNNNLISQSRSIALTSYKQEKVAEQCFNVIVKATQLQKIAFIGLSASKFIKAKGSENFKNFFKIGASDKLNSEENNTNINNINENSEVDKESKKIDVSVNVYVNNTKLNEKIDISANHTKLNEKVDVGVNNTKLSEKNINNCYEEKKIHKTTATPVKKKSNRKSSPCSSLKQSLKSDYFKKSFFMNILKEKQPEDRQTEFKVEETCFKTELLDTENQNIDSVENLSDDGENIIEEVSHNVQNFSDKNSVASNSETTVALNEIFPDLNDIDPNIVQMLPFHLQQEAKKLLKLSEVRDKNNEINKAKNKETTNVKTKEKISLVKEKTVKLKSNNLKPKNIQNFFIKTDTNNDVNNYKKCTECDQLILVNKFDEHKDYHIARNLQKEINQLPNSDENRKRKGSLEIESPSKKRLSSEFVSGV